jgi:hypothetical protein
VADAPAPPAGGAVDARPEVPRPRSVLEEEREFFLRSLRDLEAERAAGDIDHDDYTALRDDYTVRAADVLRQLDAPARTAATAGSPSPTGPATPAGDGGGPLARLGRHRWSTLVAGGLGVVLVLAGITWAVSAAAGVRLPGDGVSGGTPTSQIDGLLLAAQTAVGDSQPVAAVKDYEAVIAADPTNAEALTGEGAVLVQTGRTSGRSDLIQLGVARLARAEKVAPTYGPAFGTLGEVLFSEGQYPAAIPQLQAYQRLTPPAARQSTVADELRLAKARSGGG